MATDFVCSGGCGGTQGLACVGERLNGSLVYFCEICLEEYRYRPVRLVNLKEEEVFELAADEVYWRQQAERELAEFYDEVNGTAYCEELNELLFEDARQR